MESIIIFIHVIAAIAITGLVLIQHGKGADMGASFGSGASQTMFGSSGTGNVLTKSTTIMAIVFFITSLGLAIIARQQADLSIQDSGLIANPDEITQTAPAVPSASEEIPTFEESVPENDIPALDASADSDIPVVDETQEAAGDIPPVETGETTD